MRTILHAFCAIALTFSLGTALPGAANAASCGRPGEAQSLQTELLRYLNAERQRHGLSALRLNPALDRAAEGHACDNARRRGVSHVSSNGAHLKQRLQRAGYKFSLAAENTGRGFGNSRRAVEWWMNSSGHRKNILMQGVREVGIGIALSPAPENRLHWVVNFGAPRS